MNIPCSAMLGQIVIVGLKSLGKSRAKCWAIRPVVSMPSYNFWWAQTILRKLRNTVEIIDQNRFSGELKSTFKRA